MTQQTSDNAVHLTQDAVDKLKSELEHLRGPVRDEIIARISAARDEGDLKENGGYHAAREEQGKNEARIRQLVAMLENADQPWQDRGHWLAWPAALLTLLWFRRGWTMRSSTAGR